MSSAESRLNLGIIFSVLSNIDETHQALDRASNSPDGLPADYQKVLAHLPLVRAVLISTEDCIKDSLVAPDFCASKVPVFHSCDEHALALRKLVVKAYPLGKVSRASKYFKGVPGLGKGNTAKNTMQELLQDMQHLTDGKAIRDVSEEQIAEMRRGVLDMQDLLARPGPGTNKFASAWLFEENKPSAIMGCKYE